MCQASAGHRTLIKTSRMKRDILETLPGAAPGAHAVLVLVPAASKPPVLPLLSLKRWFQNQPRSQPVRGGQAYLTHSSHHGFSLHPRLGVP